MQQGARELNNLIEQISKKVVDKAIDEKYLMSRMAVIVNEFDAATNSASVIIPTDLEHPTDYKYPNRTGKIRLHNTVWNGKDIVTYGDKVYLVYQTNNISQGWLEGNNALNIDASKYVLKSGDTMTGNLNLNVSNGAVKVTDPTYGVATSLLVGSGHINHGLYSYNYYNGTSLVSNGTWMLYRNTNGDVIMNGNASKDSDGNVITSTYIKQGTEVQTTGTDLNDYTTTGIYHFTSSYTPTNIPVGNNGWLMVMKVPNTASVKQIWFRQGTNGTNDWHTFVRQYSGSAWSAWKRYIVDGDTLSNDLNFAANKGINFNTSGRVYWKENNYGDQFAIVPAFSGADDANLLKIQSAVGAQGTTPTMTDKITIAGKTGSVNLLTGDLTLTAGSLNTNAGAINTVGDLNLKTSGSSSDDSADIVWWYGNGTEKMRIWSPNTPTAKVGPSFRIFNSSGTSLYSGTLPLADGTGASGTWGINVSGSSATTDAIHVYDTNPSSGSTYFPVWSADKSSGVNYNMRANDGLKYLTREGDTSDDGYGGLRIGNTTPSGTAGNKWGFVDLYPKTGAYYARIKTADTLTANRNFTLPDAGGTVLATNAQNFVSLFNGTLNSSTTSTTFTGANYSAYCIVGAEGRGYRSSIVVPRALITTTAEQWMVTFYGASSIENVRFTLQASAATGGTITITWQSGKTIKQVYGIR